MKKTFLMLATMLLCAMSSMAQVSQILGDWVTIDDQTKEERSVVHIYKGTDGLYYGKIAKMLVGQGDEKCIECQGADKNKPLVGLIIIRGFHEEKGELVGGKVLDPENGKFYYGKIYLKDGKLVLRGSIDKMGVLGRSQTWRRKK